MCIEAIDGTLTAQRHIDNILQPVVLPILQQHDDVTTFQQDNARPYSARISMEYLNNLLDITKTRLDRRENIPRKLCRAHCSCSSGMGSNSPNADSTVDLQILVILDIEVCELTF